MSNFSLAGDDLFGRLFRLMGRQLHRPLTARTDRQECRTRTRFAGRISAGILEEIEDQCVTGGPVFTFKINGTF